MSNPNKSADLTRKPPPGRDVASGTWVFGRGFGNAYIEVVATEHESKLIVWEVLSGRIVMELDMVQESEVAHAQS